MTNSVKLVLIIANDQKRRDARREFLVEAVYPQVHTPSVRTTTGNHWKGLYARWAERSAIGPRLRKLQKRRLDRWVGSHPVVLLSGSR